MFIFFPIIRIHNIHLLSFLRNYYIAQKAILYQNFDCSLSSKHKNSWTISIRNCISLRDEQNNCLSFLATRPDVLCSRVVFDLLLLLIFLISCLAVTKTSVSFNQFPSRWHKWHVICHLSNVRSEIEKYWYTAKSQTQETVEQVNSNLKFHDC